MVETDVLGAERRPEPAVARSPLELSQVKRRAMRSCPKFRLKSPNFIYKSSKIVSNFSQNFVPGSAPHAFVPAHGNKGPLQLTFTVLHSAAPTAQSGDASPTCVQLGS